MIIDTSVLVPMTEANQNFSKVARLVDEKGMAVILKNNKPRYTIMDFSEYDALRDVRRKIVDEMSDEVLEEYLEAFKELAK